MLARLLRSFTATPRKYQSRHKCPKGVLKICEQAPIFNLAFCTFGVRPLLRSAQSQRSLVRPATSATCVTFDTLCHIFCHCHTVTHPCGNVSCDKLALWLLAIGFSVVSAARINISRQRRANSYLIYLNIIIFLNA